MPIVAPSLLACDFLNLEKEIRDVNASGVEWLHYDVMDGHFVPNLTFGAPILKQIRTKTDLFLDVHLMVNNPEIFISDFIDAGANGITVHVENTPHIHKTIMHLKESNIKAGIAINPGTSWSAHEAIIPFVDYVLFMSVNPGFGGQKFIAETLDNVRSFKEYIAKKKYNIQISIDGGINKETGILAVNAGCDVLVVGNAFFKNSSSTYKETSSYYHGLK